MLVWPNSQNLGCLQGLQQDLDYVVLLEALEGLASGPQALVRAQLARVLAPNARVLLAPVLPLLLEGELQISLLLANLGFDLRVLVGVGFLQDARDLRRLGQVHGILEPRLEQDSWRTLTRQAIC